MIRLERYRPQFATIDEMDQELIQKWNSVVGPKDIIYHLGDFSFANKQRTDEILAALKGHITLIYGNHDHHGKNFPRAAKLRFDAMIPYLELKPQGTPRITLLHYPMLVWNQSHYGSWHLHGHSHGSCRAPGKRWDVGVDNNDLTPVCIDDLHQIMHTKTTSYADYHKENFNEPS